MERSGLSRLEMGLSVLVVVMLVATAIFGYMLISERDKPKDVEAGEGIAGVAFVREGVVVVLDQEEEVDTLTLFDSAGDQISVIEVGAMTPRVLADLDWIPDMKYRFDVQLKNGDVLSTPAYAPLKPVPYKLFEISYESIFPKDEYHASTTAHSHVEAVLKFSRDGTRLAVGGLEGRASVIDVTTGTEVWHTTLENLKIESVEYSDDGNYIFFGGHHLDWKIWCLDAATGNEVWSDTLKAEMGGTADYSAPSTYVQTVGDKVWMGLSASWLKVVEPEETRSYMTEPRNESLLRYYRSKIICYKVSNGERVWTFPQDGDTSYDDWGGGVMDRGIMQDSIMLDDQARYLSIAFSSRNGDTTYYDAQLVVFDAQAGSMKWNWSMPILRSIRKGNETVPLCYRSHITNAWLSGDGKYIAVGSHDGRGYLFDNEKNVADGVGAPEWERNLGKPVVMDDTIVHTSDICPYTDGKLVLFYVSRTQDEWGYGGNSKIHWIYGTRDYVCMDLNGMLNWQYKLSDLRAYAGTGRYAYGEGGGYVSFGSEHQEITGLTQDSDTIHFTYTRHPTKTESYYSVLDLDRGSYDAYTHEMWKVKLDGVPGSQGDITGDGWFLAFVESPIDKDTTGDSPDVVGEYKVMVYV